MSLPDGGVFLFDNIVDMREDEGVIGSTAAELEIARRLITISPR